MFQRANKIVITESSATKRSHPAVGDTGYINNMYLFFADRFILLDAFFFRYESDIKRNRTRRERKRFIIDLGMKKSLKHKLEIYGVPRKFFLENNYVTNLTVSEYTIGDNAGLSEYPNIGSLWYNQYDKVGHNKSESLVKIPYGQIMLAPDRRKSIQSDGPSALCCWIECIIPLVENAVALRPGDNMPDNSFSKMVAKIYIRRLSRYVRRPKNDPNGMALALNRDIQSCLSPKGRHNLIMDMQMIHVLSGSLLNNCNTNILKNNFVIQERLRFSDIWKYHGFMKAYESVQPATAKALAGLFFRSVIVAGDTEKKLFELGTTGIVPWSYEMTKSKAKKFGDIKRAANFGSAALNRIFEEDLLS